MISGIEQSAIVEYEIEGEEQMSGDFLSSRSTRINFWHALVFNQYIYEVCLELFANPQIPEKLKNLGMGDRLANAALDYAMERGMKVRLTHPFLRFPVGISSPGKDPLLGTLWLTFKLRKWIELNGTASQKAIVVSGAPKPAPGEKPAPSRPEKPKPMFPVYNRSHGNFMNEYELPK